MRMDEERLIELVKEKDLLYNKFNPEYREINRKKAAWVKIAHELRIPVDQCIKKWTSMRERFSRENRLCDSQAESGAPRRSSWFFYKQMRFLKDHVKPRAKRCIANTAPINREVTSPYSSLASSPILSEAPPTSERQSFKREADEDESTHNEEEAEFTEVHTARKARGVKRKAREDDSHNDDAEFREVCAAIKTVCRERIARRENATVAAFGDMMVATISSMSIEMQRTAMKGVTDFIMSLQMEENDDTNQE